MARIPKTCGRKQSRYAVGLGGVGALNQKELAKTCADKLRRAGVYGNLLLGDKRRPKSMPPVDGGATVP